VSRPDLAAGAVVTKSHLSIVRVRAESFRRHHPGARVFVLLVDRNDGHVVPEREPFELIELERLRIPGLLRLCFQYTAFELNCAAKPFLLAYLLHREHIPRVVYLDSDILVYRELHEAIQLLEEHSVLLTPHLVRDVRDDGKKPGYRDFRASGVYNAGFVGVRNDPVAKRFLDWWSSQVYDRCIADPEIGLFVDQRWLDLVPRHVR
jgi:hypothetical protein